MAPPIPFLDLSAATAELRPKLDEAFARVMDSGHYVLSTEVDVFEREFADFVGSDHAIGVGNGLDALMLALTAIGIGPGDEVVVPGHTFIATWLAVSQLGAVPIAAEPGEDCFNVSANTIAAVLTPRTRAIVIVHLYGEPVETEAIRTLCETRQIALVEDAAQAHGALRNGVQVGSLGDVAAFSFYPGKNLGAYGDGGAVTTSDAELAKRVRRLRNYGALRKYDHETLGRNSRLDALQAALLCVKLPYLAAWNAKRREIAAMYSSGLADIEGLRLPRTLVGNEPVWHLYVLRTAYRDALRDYLASAGIETGIHYPRAVYRCPPYRALAPSTTTFSDQLANEVISLPMGPHLTVHQAQAVVSVVREFFTTPSLYAVKSYESDTKITGKRDHGPSQFFRR